MDHLKKTSLRILLIICGVIAGILISSALFTFTGFSIFGRFHDKAPPPVEMSKAEFITLACNVVEYIKNGDFISLSEAAHPEFGVVFSPRATVTLSTNRRFGAEQIAAIGDDTNVYVWGVCNGSGEPIEMTPADYFAKYVFDKDYTAASVIGVDHIVRSGNALENITDIFSDVRFVDFYISGGDKDASDSLGWSILRLGFEEYEGKLWLTAIIHSEWTE